jgi:hypothetical protein
LVTTVPTIPVGNERVVVGKTLAGASNVCNCEDTGAAVEPPFEQDVNANAVPAATSATTRIRVIKCNTAFRRFNRTHRALASNGDVVVQFAVPTVAVIKTLS